MNQWRDLLIALEEVDERLEAMRASDLPSMEAFGQTVEERGRLLAEMAHLQPSTMDSESASHLQKLAGRGACLRQAMATVRNRCIQMQRFTQ